jgi:hypothetical protein
VIPCVTFSFEKEFGSEKSQLLNVSIRLEGLHGGDIKCEVCGDTMCYILF